MNKHSQSIIFFSLLLCISLIPVSADSIGGTFKAGNEYDIDSILIKGSINDYAGIISVDDKETIQSSLTDLIDDGSYNFMLITVGNLQGKNIDRFAKEILESKFGSVPDNAILFIFSLDDRRYTFYLGRTVTLNIPKSFFTNLGSVSTKDFFSRGEYSKGILNIVNKFHDAVINGNIVEVPPETQEAEQKSGFNLAAISFFRWAIIIFVVTLVLLIIVANILSIKKNNYGKNLSAISEHNDDEYFSAANLASTLFARELEKSGNYRKGI